MATYENWSLDKKDLLNTIRNPDQVTLDKMKLSSRPCKWRLVVEPEIDVATRKKGAMTFSDTERSWVVADKTQEEKDLHALGVATAAELSSEIESNPLTGKTFAQAEAYINNSVTDLPSAKEVLVKLANSLIILERRGF